MNRNRIFGALLLLALPGCAQTPKLAAPAPAPAQTATAAPQVLTAKPAAPSIDPATFAQVQANLRALGYAVGKGSDPADPAFQHALMSFQKDQGLAEDGQIGVQVIEKLRVMRAALRTVPAAPLPGVFVYSVRASRQPLTLSSPPEGFSSDAPASFLAPLKAGSQAVLHLTRKGTAPLAITCRVGKMATSNLALGAFETLAVDCRGEGASDPQWHDLFSPRLGVVVQRQSGAATQDLIAVRPPTAGWPQPVRTGLDWALSHALDEPTASTSLQWSSTAVVPRFDIKVTARVKGAEAGLGKVYAAALCRRFELIQTGAQAGVKTSYPGIACQNAAGDWALPGSGVSIARPAGHANAGPPSLRSAAN
jgi:peptidoglycan hydrolase-like protein with peptidoglycan-binding domain